MTIEETSLSGCLLLQPKLFNDTRGYFFESFNKNAFEKLIGSACDFVQDNQSFSSYGTIRGLHFQVGDYAQAKLIRAISGQILDVVVDLRSDSPTYGSWMTQILDDKENKQLFIPRGFAHGFAVLSLTAVIAYKCDNYYNKEHERGIRFDDPTLAIDWELPESARILSEKDLYLPLLNQI